MTAADAFALVGRLERLLDGEEEEEEEPQQGKEQEEEEGERSADGKDLARAALAALDAALASGIADPEEAVQAHLARVFVLSCGIEGVHDQESAFVSLEAAQEAAEAAGSGSSAADVVAETRAALEMAFGGGAFADEGEDGGEEGYEGDGASVPLLLTDGALTRGFAAVLSEAFARFDVDGDGVLSGPELGAFCACVNGPSADVDDLRNFLRSQPVVECEPEGSGWPTLAGFVALFAAQAGGGADGAEETWKDLAQLGFGPDDVRRLDAADDDVGAVPGPEEQEPQQEQSGETMDGDQGMDD
jgi:hypothetical protein